MSDKDINFIISLIVVCLAIIGLFTPYSIDYMQIENIPNINIYEGLVLWLPFNGVGLDKSGYNNDGTVNGAVFDIDGVYDECIAFNESDSVTVSYDESLISSTELSVCFWIKCNEGYGNLYPRIFEHGYINRQYNYIDSYNGKLNIFIYTLDAEAYIQTDDVLPTDEWIFIYWDYNGTYINLYLNGIYSKSSSLFSGLIKWTDADFVIGNNVGGSRGLNGTIDDFRLYNRVLNSYEIEYLYNLEI